MTTSQSTTPSTVQRGDTITVGAHQRTGCVAHFDGAKPLEDAKDFGDPITASWRHASMEREDRIAIQVDLRPVHWHNAPDMPPSIAPTAEEQEEFGIHSLHRSAQQSSRCMYIISCNPFTFKFEGGVLW